MAKIERDPDAIERAAQGAALGGPDMEQYADFEIGAILTVLNGGHLLLADLDDLYTLADYVTGTHAMTHQKPAQIDVALPYLQAVCTDLASLDLTGLREALVHVPENHRIVFCKGWLQAIADAHGGHKRRVYKPRETATLDAGAGLDRLGAGRA